MSNISSSGLCLPIGTYLRQNNYQIEDYLGQGGFGITYKAIYRRNNARIAIKELWTENGYRQGTTMIWPSSIPPASKREQIEKFGIEASYLKQCKSENITDVYDWFEENNTIYMVMELIDGQPLSSVIRTEGLLSERRLVNYIIQVASALDIVHQNNLLHRDIKPDNIMLDKCDRAVLIDFGTAREFIAGKTGDMTRMLTPAYAPIEQYLSRTKRLPATDLYSLCACMYELLTGELPSSSMERSYALADESTDPLIPPRQLNSNINPSLEQIILQGMRFRIEERWQTARELIDNLNIIFPNKPPRASLTSQHQNAPITRYSLSKINLIGLFSTDTGPVDIDLEGFPGDSTVSRHHAEISWQGGRWTIRDLGSTNGIFIKPTGRNRFGTRITTPVILNSGDEIAFGRVRFLFETMT